VKLWRIAVQVKRHPADPFQDRPDGFSARICSGWTFAQEGTMIFWSKSHVPGVNETVWGSKMRITASSGIGPTGSIKILADPDSSPLNIERKCDARHETSTGFKIR
jgi:hypothetical protein